MILVLAGTLDGRQLGKFLRENGLRVALSVTSEYGAALAEGCADFINHEALDEVALEKFVSEHQIKIIVDASHPYAQKVSALAMAVSASNNLQYIRYERQQNTFIDYDKMFFVDTIAAAAQQACALGKNIFLTTGSRALPEFCQYINLEEYNLTVRVLPDAKVLAECVALGLTPKNIVAMQGPFSQEFNKEMFLHYQAAVIIMKDSGPVGGTEEKILAAKDLKINVVLITRPKINYGTVCRDFAEVLNKCKQIK